MQWMWNERSSINVRKVNGGEKNGGDEGDMNKGVGEDISEGRGEERTSKRRRLVMDSVTSNIAHELCNVKARELLATEA